MNLFQSFITFLLIAFLFICTDLFLIHQEAAVGRILSSNKHQIGMASLMTKLVKNLIEGQTPVVVYPENCVKDVLQLMEQHHLSSVPMVASKEQPTVMGIVDALDLVSLLLDQHIKDFEHGEVGPHTREFWQNQTTRFHNIPVTQAIDYSRKQPVQIIHQSATLREVINAFLQKSHRVAVVDDRNHFQGILSQSRIIEYLTSIDSAQQIPGLKSEICLKEFVTSNVVTVKDSLLAWKAFQVLREHDITSVAVVDDKELFYDVISASDIKILNKHLMDVFLRSSRVFVELRKKSDRPPIAIYTDNLTPMIDIMRTMNREKVHRVFILKDHKCSGVISMTDIMKQVSKDSLPKT